MTRIAEGFLLATLLSSCSVLSGSARIVDTATGDELTPPQLADALVEYDVVFLGEEHDSDHAHRMQLRIVELLLERRGEVAISLEMFERDIQSQLDLYLRGGIDEARFLEHSRPWPNYARHYRPIIELAKREGLDVIAANCPRPLAAKVSQAGLAAVLGDPYCAYHIDVTDGPYRDRFTAAMGDHANDLGTRMDDFFAAQVVKDETMADSIARYLAERGPGAPIVVHLCGKFHSDYGLGTVARLIRRRPGVRVAVVSTIGTSDTGRALAPEERELGEFVWFVPARD